MGEGKWIGEIIQDIMNQLRRRRADRITKRPWTPERSRKVDETCEILSTTAYYTNWEND